MVTEDASRDIESDSDSLFELEIESDGVTSPFVFEPQLEHKRPVIILLSWRMHVLNDKKCDIFAMVWGIRCVTANLV